MHLVITALAAAAVVYALVRSAGAKPDERRSRRTRRNFGVPRRRGA